MQRTLYQFWLVRPPHMHQVWTLYIEHNNKCFNRLILGLINNNSIHNWLVKKSQPVFTYETIEE